MSRSSPCCGARPCCLKKRWISSNPAMMRSSRGGRPPLASGAANSESASASSSRSGSLIATLSFVAHEGGGTLGHAALPRILRIKCGHATALLLELDGADRKLLRFVWRQVRAFGGDCRRDLLQAVLAHGLSEDRVRLPEGVDAVDQVDVQFAYVHR